MHRTDFSFSLPGQCCGNDELSCTILSGPPGCGKSSAMLGEIATIPGRYVLAAPRIDLVEEHAARLRDLVHDVDASVRPIVQVVHSQQTGANSSVDRRLQDELARVVSPHIVILTTHVGLMGLARPDFEGWHVRIDELPETAILSGNIGLGASWRAMAALYMLVPATEPGWSRLIPNSNAEMLGLRQIRADVGTGLVDLHRLAASRGRVVEVDLLTWEDAGVPGRQIRWRSIWTFAELRGCASLQIAAAGYSGSLIGHATRHAGGIRVDTVDISAPRTGQPRIRIHWYTRHAGSTTWWSTYKGSACLSAIGRHLRQTGFAGYWTANAAAAPYLRHQFAGTEISPRSAGTNTLRDRTACAIVYSSKATKADKAVMAELGLDRDAIRIAREDEDIYQAVTRGAIRDLSFADDYSVHVYDEGQALRLRDRLWAGGYTDVSLVPVVEAGILDVIRPTCGRRKQAPDTQAETAVVRQERRRLAEKERGQRRRDADRAERIQAGTYRGRGRPRHTA